MLAIAVAAVLTLGVGMAGAFTRGRGHAECVDYSGPTCYDAFDQSTAPPHAYIGQRHVVVNTPTTFDGGLADGPGFDRSVASYAWDFGGGVTSADAHPVETFTSTGTRHVQLTVTLADGSAVTAQENLVVAASQPLEVEIEPPYEVGVGAPENFFAGVRDRDSYDSGDPTLDWDFGDNSPVSHDANPSHAYASAGNYKITVTAHVNGKTASGSAWIAVSAASPSGLAFDGPGYGDDVTAGDPGDFLCYGPITSCHIDFGDGQSADAALTPRGTFSATHAYTALGAHDAKATMTLSGGGTAVRMASVNVVAAPPRSVTADYYGQHNHRVHVGAPVELDAEPTGFDDSAQFTWTFDDGTAVQAGGDHGELEHTYTTAGLHQATVTVSQPGGSDVTDSVWIPVDNSADIPRVVGLYVPDDAATGEEAFFFGGVYDEDGVGDEAAYQWSFDGVPDTAYTDAYATHTFTTAGTHSAKVVVSEPNKPTVQRERTFSVAGGTAPSGGGGGTPPAGGGTPPPAPSPVPVIAPAPAKAAVSGSLPKRGSLKKGIKFSVKCSSACTLKATVTLPKALAKRFKLKGALATAKVHLSKGGKVTIKLKPTKAARKLLRKLKGKTVTLTVTGGRHTLHRKVKLT